MASLNYVLLIGNLTRDPETRSIPSGKTVTEMRLAVSRKFRTASGEDREETCFVDVVVWDRQGENCKKYLNKGSPALVEGRLQYDEWEKDGKKNSKIRVVADRVQFLGSPRKTAAVADTVDGEISESAARPSVDEGGEAAPF